MRPGRDRGSATVWAALATTVLCAVFAAVLAMGQAVVTRHRAGSAADLAALAAADHALWGAPAACAKAVEVARAQDAEVVRCAVRGERAEVTALARLGPYAPQVRSRAGPGQGPPPGPGRGSPWPQDPGRGPPRPPATEPGSLRPPGPAGAPVRAVSPPGARASPRAQPTGR